MDAVSILLDSGADPSIGDSQKRSPLYMVAFRGYPKACKLLLENNADPNTIDVDGTSPLHASIWNSKSNVTKLLLEHAADINRTEFFHGNSPLHIAIQMKHFELCDLLIKVSSLCTHHSLTIHQQQANINYQRICDGNSPLHYSIECDFLVLGRFLARMPDTDLSLKNKSGETAISMAINRNTDPDFIRSLKAAKDKATQQ